MVLSRKKKLDGLVCISEDKTIFIPVTRRVKGYTRFVGKYVTGRRIYIFLIRITSRVDLDCDFVGLLATRLVRLAQ